LVVLKKNNQSIFDTVTLKTFNELFGICLSYNVFNYVAYFNNDGILKPDQLKELDLINEQRKNHLWLEQKILSSTGDVKKTIYGFIKYTFSNSFEYELSRVSDEILLLLIPYLNESIIHEILNNYNKENSTVIKLLLEKGGKFYNQYQGNPNKKIEFKYSTIDFRTMREIEIDKNRVSSRFDMIKTLQFKLLLGIK
jgi:hypothetical protein